jgi:hypothetical protein
MQTINSIQTGAVLAALALVAVPVSAQTSTSDSAARTSPGATDPATS